MNIGQRIRDKRKKLGLSAEDVAEIINVSAATIYRYESEDILNMRIDKLVPIAEALKTTPSYLMGWDENKSLNSTDIRLSEITETYDDLTETGKQELLKHARRLLLAEQYEMRDFYTGKMAAKGGDSEIREEKPPWEE